MRVKTVPIFLGLLLALIFALVSSSVSVAAQIGEITYDSTVRGRLSSEEPVQEWGFWGNGGDVITISMIALPDPDITSPFDTYLYLITEEGELLAEDDDGGEAYNSLIRNFQLPANAYYIIQATSVGSEAGGSYDLSLELVRRQGQSIEYADYLVSGDERRAELSFSVSAHIWDFDGRAGDRVEIRMEAISGELDTFLLLLDADDELFNRIMVSMSAGAIDSLVEFAEELGVLVAYNDDGQTTNSLIRDVTLPADGPYFIIATSCCTGGSFGDYWLSLDLIPAQSSQVGYNGSLGYGDADTGDLTEEYPAHVWEFLGQEGDRIDIHMTALEGELDSYLLLLQMDDSLLEELYSLRDEDLTRLPEITDELGGLLILDDDGGGSGNAHIADYQLPATGAYQIVTTSCCTAGSYGSYELFLEGESAQERWIEFAGGLEYGDVIEAGLGPELVAQVWEFAGQERDEISIQMDALDGDLDPFLLLLSMSSRELDQFMSQGIEQPEGLVEIAERLGVLVHYNDDREDSADSLIFSDPLPADDVYYIVATSCCTAGSAGDYRLALELEFREEPLTETDPETERERDLEQPPDDDRNFIPETTRIIDEGIASRHLIDITGDGETLTFDEDVVDSLGRPFEENDIVALDPVDDAPFGLLRRVVEIEHDQGQVVLTTVQAALDEAIYNGQVQVEVVLTEDGGYIAQAAMGKTSAKPAARPAGAEFTLNFFEEEIIPGVTASGQVDLDPSFEFELVIRRFKLERLRLVNTTVQRAEISLEAEIGFSESAEIELSPLGSFAPIGIPIRGTSFNIWLTPQLTVYLGVAGSATAAVTSAVHHDITYDSGLEYDDGDLRFIADSTGSELWVEEPETSASVDARAYIKPEFALVVFGGSGPYINAQGYARFEADMCQSPWWEVYAGVSGNVGARVKVFSLKLIDETWQIFVEEWTLDEAEDSAPFACPGEDESEPTSAPQDSSPEDDGGGGVCSSVVGFVGILGLVVTFTRRKRR